MRSIPILLLATLLSACAAPTVSIPVGAACIAYGQGRADYAKADLIVTQACKAGKLTADVCEMAKAIDVRAKVLRESVESALLNPAQPIDWGQVMQYSASVTELLLRVGVLP